MLGLYVDGDACPVKPEVYKVARRLGLKVIVVGAALLRTPGDLDVQVIAAGQGFNAADDWIAVHIGKDDICVTADVPLAARCLAVGAHALGPRGQPFTEESIGEALATRDLMSSLRGAGMIGGGPAPITQRDRSEFLNQLDRLIQAIRNRRTA